jgi:hypothetical protein
LDHLKKHWGTSRLLVLLVPSTQILPVRERRRGEKRGERRGKRGEGGEEEKRGRREGKRERRGERGW